MAWSFVGVSNNVEVTAATHTLVTTGITGLAAGDLLVACISSRIASTTPITLPTGGEWTLVGQQNANNILTNANATASGLMAYCVRGASNPNLTFTHPTAPSVAVGRIIAYRGVVPASPLDAQTAFTTATNTTAVSGTGLTTTNAGDLIVAMAAGGRNSNWSAFNATSPSGASGTGSITTAPTTSWLERADLLTATGSDTGLGIFDAIQTTAGATGNLTVTASVSGAHVVVAGAFKSTDKRIAADAGSYTLTGAATTNTLLRRKVVAAVGSYALTGTAATLTLEAAGGGGGGPVVVNYLALSGYADGSSSFTSTVDIGAQDDTKLIVAMASSVGGAISTGVLDGVSGVAYEMQNWETNNRHIVAFVFEMPTQSGSKSFTITTGAALWAGISVHWFEVLNAEPVPADTANDVGIPLSTTVTAVADGAVLNLANGYGSGDTITFSGSGWTLSSHYAVGGNVSRSGHNAAAAGSFTTDATFSPGNTGQAQITLAFEPLPGGPVGYTLPADAGSYAVSGQPVTLTKGRRIVAEVGSYALTGTVAALIKSGAAKILVAEPGSYALTGTAATPKHGWKVTATTVGAYALTGQTATLRPSRRLLASAGGYSISGTSANLTASTASIFVYVGHSLVDSINQQMTLILPGDQYYQTIVGAPLSTNWEYHDIASFDARDYCASNPVTDLVLCENNTIAPHNAKPWIEVWRNNALAVSPNVRTWWYQCWQTIPSGGTDFATWKTNMAAYVAAHEVQIQQLYLSIGTNHPKMIPAGAAMVALVDAVEDSLITGITDPSDLFTDDVHPDDPGQYFVAMVHYAALTGTSPVGLSNTLGDATVTTTQAAELQALAWSFTSAYPYAGIADWPEPPSNEGEITLGTMGTDTIDVSSPNYNDCSVDFGTARAGRTLVMFFGGANTGQLGQTCVIDPAGAAISVALIDSTDASETAYASTLFYGAVPSGIAGTLTVRVDVTSTGAHGRCYWMVLDGATSAPKEVLLAKGDFADQINGDVCFFFASGGFNETTGADAPDAAWNTYGAWDTKVFRAYGASGGSGWDAVHTIDGNDPWGLSDAAAGNRIMQLLLEPAVPPKTIAAADGFYLVSGTAATPKHGWKSIATTIGSYAIAGQLATTRHGWKVIATTVGAYAITGQPATPTKIAAKTIVAASGAYSISGQTAATLHRWKVIATTVGSYALSGQSAIPRYGYRVIATTIGAYSLAGQPVTLRRNLPIVAGAGAYALTGQPATFRHTWRVIATTVGAYTLAGQDATPVKAGSGSYVTVANAGAYALTGQTTATLHRWKLDAITAGAYAVSGQPATTRHGWKVTATTVGAYTLAGQLATTRHGWKVIATTVGAYAITGFPATPSKVAGKFVLADPGSYALTGQDATTRHIWRSTATTVGAYSIIGQPATTTRGRRIIATTIGAYTLAGQPATLRHVWKIPAETGGYLITGSPAAIIRLGAFALIAEAGSYAIAGQVASTKRGRKVTATTIGAYALSGQPVTLRRTWKIAAAPDGYVLTGKPANPRSALTPAPAERSDRIPASLRYHRLEAANRYAIVPEGQRGDSA